MAAIRPIFKTNRTRLFVGSALILLLVFAIRGMDTEDWAITILRGLSTGALIFLVASGLSLIFGLMDVLNLAHGELFMIGAYVGWTVYVRPDTFVDLLTPLAMVAAGFALFPFWQRLLSRLTIPPRPSRLWPWVMLLLGAAILLFALRAYPLSIWDPEVYAQSPVTYSLAFSQGTLVFPQPPSFTGAAVLIFGGIFLGSAIIVLAWAGFNRLRQQEAVTAATNRPLLIAFIFFVVGLLLFWLNDPLTAALANLSTSWLFLIAAIIAVLTGFGLGALIESGLVRPLYDRPIYQIMLTLGLSFIGIELVRAIWGQPEFTMPKPALFDGSGEGCPATNLGDLLAHQCSTILLFDTRIRTYNEIFIILVGLVVLVGIWLLLQRTRLGMIIRAGVQDSEMVEALGINVRRVFTLVFALGCGLAALGGLLAAPSIGLSSHMGTSFLLSALIALAIGGLTSFPGAAVGAVLVGLLEQFMIKYGQIGINLPFLAEPFKPTPPLVPASVVLLMVIILLLLPTGLFGRKE